MEDDVSEKITQQECRWALHKWRRSCPLPNDKIVSLVKLMNKEPVIQEKLQTRCDELTHHSDRFLDVILERVAEKRGRSLKVFISALENLTLERGNLQNWLHKACLPCHFSSPVLLSDEIDILDKAKASHDLKILTCSKCTGIMQDPVLLKCFHSCCKKCLEKNDNCCPACKTMHDGDVVRNYSLERYMKFSATNIASEKCVYCLTTTGTPSKFCHDCQEYYCSLHCCTNGHKLEEKEEYLKTKKRDSYQLLCSYHELKMMYYCRDCNTLRCDHYLATCEDLKHISMRLSAAAKEPRNYMQSFLKQHEFLMVQAVDDYLKTSCANLQTLCENLLVTNTKSAVNATEEALGKAKEAVQTYCESLQKDAEPLLCRIHQFGIHFNFLLNMEDAWIVQQWPVVTRQLDLLRQMGSEPPTFAENQSPTAFQSSNGTNHDGNNCLLLQVDYVDPFSVTSAALIKQLVGVPEKKIAGSPANLLEMLKTNQNNTKSVMKQKVQFDEVEKLREQVHQLQRENEGLRHKLKRREEQMECSRSGSNLMENFKSVCDVLRTRMSLQEVKHVVGILHASQLLFEGDCEHIKNEDSDIEASDRLINVIRKRDLKFLELFLSILKNVLRRNDLVDLIQSG